MASSSPTIDVPSSIGYKDQALTPEELWSGQRVEPQSLSVLPSDIDYKDQALTPEELQNGQRVAVSHQSRNVPVVRATPIQRRGEPAVAATNANMPSSNASPILSGYPLAVPANQSTNSRHKKTVLLIVLLIFLLIGAGVGVAIGVTSSNKQENTSSSEPQSSSTTTTIVPSGTPINTPAPSLGNVSTPTVQPTSRMPFAVIGSWEQLGPTISEAEAGDRLGHFLSLSADGNTLAVSYGVDFDNHNEGEQRGFVQIFRRDDDDNNNNSTTTWEPLGTPLQGVAVGDRFGASRMKLSADGTVVAVGAQYFDDFAADGGHLRVFGYTDAGGWEQLGQDLNYENPTVNAYFGYDVGLSADGSIVASGANLGNFGESNNLLGTGGLIVFEYSNLASRWQQVGQVIVGSEPEENFGRRVALSANGRIVAGSGFPQSGGDFPGVVRVYRYDVVAGNWEKAGQDLFGSVGDRFGQSLSLSSDGSILAVGADLYGDDNSGQVIVYQLNFSSNRWQQLGQALTGQAAGDFMGWSVSLSTDGLVLAAGANGHASNTGRVYVWEYKSTTNNWVPRGQFLDGSAEFDLFGFQVSLSGDGRTLASGAFLNDDNGSDSGFVRVFDYQA